MWNFLCQYNNIYKRKKNCKQKTKKTITTVSTVEPGIVVTVRNKNKKGQSSSPNFHFRWTVRYVEWTVCKYCCGIADFYIVNRLILMRCGWCFVVLSPLSQNSAHELEI